MLSHLNHPVPAITYHRVLPQAAPLAVVVDAFERQLQGLQCQGYRTLTGGEFAQSLRGELATKRTVFLRFDDGYPDNWYLATPLLKKYGFKASLFVVTGKILDQRSQ